MKLAMVQALVSEVAALPDVLFPRGPLGSREPAGSRLLPEQSKHVSEVAQPYIRKLEKAFCKALHPHRVDWTPMGNRVTWYRDRWLQVQIELSGRIVVASIDPLDWVSTQARVQFCIFPLSATHFQKQVATLKAAADALGPWEITP